MKIIERKTKEEKVFITRNSVLKYLFEPISNDFSMVSNVFLEVLEEYKDVPLTKKKLGRKALKRIEIDSEYAENISTYEVKGFDQIVGSDKFDQKIRNEFYERFLLQDEKLFKFINEKNPNYMIIF